MKATRMTNQTERIPREQVAHELRHIFENFRLTPESDQGWLEQGDRVGVAIGSSGLSPKNTLDITVLVYGRDGRPAEVDGIPIFLIREKAHQPLMIWNGKTNHRGDVAFHNLSSGIYRMHIPKVFGGSNAVIDWFPRSTESEVARSKVHQLDSYGLVATGDVHDRLAAAASKQPEKSISKDLCYYESEDGKIRSIVRQTRRGLTEVSFSTADVTYASAAIAFSLVQQESRHVESHVIVRFSRVEGEEALWEALWKGRITVTEPCELLFELVERPAEMN